MNIKNKYINILIFLIIIILFINYIYYINNNNIEKFNTKTCDNEYVNNASIIFCNNFCPKYIKENDKQRCKEICPSIAKNKIVKGLSIGIEDRYRKIFNYHLNENNKELKNLNVDINNQQSTINRYENLIKKCNIDPDILTKNELNDNKGNNWKKIGKNNDEYMYYSNINQCDNNYVKKNKYILNKNFKNKLNTLNIYGLKWKFLAKYEIIKNQLNKFKFKEYKNDYIINKIKNKIYYKLPIEFNIEEIPDNILKSLKKNIYIIINEHVFIPISNFNPDNNNLWLYTQKDIAKIRENLFNKYNKSKEELINKYKNNCAYSNTYNFGNSFIDKNNIKWGKIGNTPNEYSNISNYNELKKKENDINKTCLIKKINATNEDNRIDNLIQQNNFVLNNGSEWGKIGNNINEYSKIKKYNDLIDENNNLMENCYIKKNNIDNLKKLNVLNLNDNSKWGKIGTKYNNFSKISKYNNKLSELNNVKNNCIIKKDDINNLKKLNVLNLNNDSKWGKIGRNDNDYSKISSDYNNYKNELNNTINNCILKKDVNLQNIGNIINNNDKIWGKIGNNDDEYSLKISNAYKEQIEKNKCLIPGEIHTDISNLPDKFTIPLNKISYGKFKKLDNSTDFDIYNYPYIDRKDLDNYVISTNSNGKCKINKANFYDKNQNPIYGLKKSEGGEYGLIGTWKDYNNDGIPRYGKIYNNNNDGWVGEIGETNGKYGMIGDEYHYRTGLRWIKFTPDNNEDHNNIIINYKLADAINKANSDVVLFTKKEFNSFNINNRILNEKSKIYVSDSWYKPFDNVYISNENCNFYKNNKIDQRKNKHTDDLSKLKNNLINKYSSEENVNFYSDLINCPKKCNEKSDKNGDCADCFRKGLISELLNIDEFNNKIIDNNTKLDDLINECNNGLIYNIDGIIKVKLNKYQHSKAIFYKYDNLDSLQMRINNNIDNYPQNIDFDFKKILNKLINGQEITIRELYINAKLKYIEYMDYIHIKYPIDGYDNSIIGYYILTDNTYNSISNGIKSLWEFEEALINSLKYKNNCDIPYKAVLKSSNTCTKDNHVCLHKNNMDENTFDSNYNKKINKLKKEYEKIGLEKAQTYTGKYYNVTEYKNKNEFKEWLKNKNSNITDDEINKLWENNIIHDNNLGILGISGESCSPINNTKPKYNKDGLEYVAPNTCPNGKKCQNKCKKGCIDDNKTCKDILQTYNKNTNDLNNILQLADNNAKKDYANKYNDGSICKSQKNYKKTNGKTFVKIGSDNACSNDNKCYAKSNQELVTEYNNLYNNWQQNYVNMCSKINRNTCIEDQNQKNKWRIV